MPKNTCAHCGRDGVDRRSKLCLACWNDPGVRRASTGGMKHAEAMARMRAHHLKYSQYPPCVHCKVRPGCRPRRLCSPCWYNEVIRNQYPPVKPGYNFGVGPLEPKVDRPAPCRPLPALDGLSGALLAMRREERVDELARRQEDSEQLFTKKDRSRSVPV